MDPIYLDFHAGTPVDPKVAQAMWPWITTHFGNPGSVHSFGREAGRGITLARDQVAALLHCRPAEVVFTGSGTESNNLALVGAAQFRRKVGRGEHLLYLASEHDSVRGPLVQLQALGFRVEEVPIGPGGVWAVEEVIGRLEPATTLVSASLANYELGVVGPIGDLARALHERDVWLHTDAALAPGWVDVDVMALEVDLLTLSAHKFGGPRGAGALYVRRGRNLIPQLVGGVQERRRRAGTENVAAVVGMGKAAELAQGRTQVERQRVAQLRGELREGIRSLWPGMVELGCDHLPGCLAVSFPGLEGEAILLGLDVEGVAVASGAACSSGSLEPSHVVRALRLPREVEMGALRLSLGFSTTRNDIDRTLAALQTVIQRQQAAFGRG